MSISKGLMIGYALVLFAASCTTVQYTGEPLPQTTRLDVYVKDAPADRPHVELGELKLFAQANRVSENRLLKRAEKEAMKRGADAIVYESIEVKNVRDRDYYAESRNRDQSDEFSRPNYDRVRIIKAKLLKFE
ncbi:MAG: hypothetical protein K1Y02_06055 [Candidatus Hydrogenedentes bacterium]|nr:hypothetical protein [Candidatus Hydrogenedentota bacterium]